MSCAAILGRAITLAIINGLTAPMEALAFIEADVEPEPPQSWSPADDTQVDDAAEPPPQSRPADGPRWRPVQIRTDQVSVAGGYCAEAHIVESITLTDGDGKAESFVKTCKNSQWFRKMAGGKDVRKGQLGYVYVLLELRDKITRN